MKVLMLMLTLTLALTPVDPTLWCEGPPGYFTPRENPSGATGQEVVGTGNVGRTDVVYWEWNIPGSKFRQIIPRQWETLDCTRNVSGGPTGVTTDAAWVELHCEMVITPPSVYGGFPGVDTSWRRFGSPFQNSEQISNRSTATRSAFSITVPCSQGKVQFLYHALGWPNLDYAHGGGAWGGHFFVNKWGR